MFVSASLESSLLDFRIGEPEGEWLDTDAGWVWNGRLPRHSERDIHRSGHQASVTLARVNELPDGGTSVDWTSSSFPKDWVGRVIVEDLSGVIHEPVPATTSLKDVVAGGWQFQSETFSNLPPARVKELRLQIRNCRWVEFRNVSLEPGHRTAAEARNAIGAQASSSRSNDTFSPVIEQAAKAPTNTLPASAASWSPMLAPSEKPELQGILAEAKDLMEKGRYEEALQRHLWYHNHALEYDQGHSGVRLSFALSDWTELGRRYPRAKQAFIEIRDGKTRELVEGRGSFALFHDVASMNGYLRDEDATCALFKTIAQRDPALARQCYFVAEALLVRQGEYELCLKYLGDPQAQFESIHQNRKVDEVLMQTDPRMNQPAFRKSSEDRFVSKVRQLIEVLVATGNKADAEKIHRQAVAVLNAPELQSALSDAEKTIATRSQARREKAK